MFNLPVQMDGVTLTTDVSLISGSFVIGRNSAFTFKGQIRRCEAARARIKRPHGRHGREERKPNRSGYWSRPGPSTHFSWIVSCDLRYG